MPSDDRIMQALELVSGQTEAFRSALAVTMDQMRKYAESQGAAQDKRADRLAIELGPFASNLVDTDRLSDVIDESEESSSAALKVVEMARKTLSDLADKGDDLFVLELEAGQNLWHAIDKALADLGRAFSAARTFEKAKANGGAGVDPKKAVEPLPFREWTSRERLLAPPLVVSVDGDQCRANALAEFLDGTQKIVLITRGETTPAPLVRLVTPGTFVAQSTDLDALKKMSNWDGPSVGALVSESAAQFVHDPKAGAEAKDRTTVVFLPEGRPRKALGGVSASQQAEELRQLKALAVPAAPGGLEEEPALPVNPADKLAAWLLTRADLQDVG